MRRRATLVAFAGRDAAEIAHRGECFARDELPAMLRPDAVQRIDRHRAQGHRLVLVSASLDLYLAPWCRQHGMELLCNRLDARDGRLTGRYNRHDIGTDKAEAIRRTAGICRAVPASAQATAAGDRPMLALAHERWYPRPAHRLMPRATIPHPPPFRHAPMTSAAELTERLDRLLPQTQCGQCGFDGCRPYAERWPAAKPASTAARPVATRAHVRWPTCWRVPSAYDRSRGVHIPPRVAEIVEADCIGCTKCIQACPVDAIAAAPSSCIPSR
jgi:HAD superfamily phosphoserine phosphatase-like hydrolase